MSDELLEQIASIEPDSKPEESQPEAKPEQQEAPAQATTPEESAKPDGDAEHQPEAQQPEKSEEDDDQPKRRNRTREYINSLKDQRNAAMQRAQQAEQRQQELMQRLQQKPEFDEDDYDAEQAHRTRQLLNEDRLEDAQRERDQAVKEHIDAGVQAYFAALDDAADRFPGLRAEVDRMPPLSAATAEFLIESDAAAEMTHWLVNNPAEVARLGRMTPAQQFRALAKQEATISAPAPARKISQAPEPPPRVQTTTAPKQPTPDEMPFEDFQKWLLDSMS